MPGQRNAPPPMIRGRDGAEGGDCHLKREFPLKITLEDMMGADAPIPHYDRCRRPAGALPRRLQFPVSPETEPAPPCRTEAVRRGALPISSIYRIFMLRVRTPVHVRFSREKNGITHGPPSGQPGGSPYPLSTGQGFPPLSISSRAKQISVTSSSRSCISRSLKKFTSAA